MCDFPVKDKETCPPLFFRGGCNELFDASVVNALIAELGNVINLVPEKTRLPYDCGRLDNVARNIAVFVKSGAETLAGMIAPFMTIKAPDGWLSCDGAAYKAADYPVLAKALGVSEDGIINLPDLRGEFIRGYIGARKNIPSQLNRAIGSNEDDLLKSHTHSAEITKDGSHTHTGTTDIAGEHRHNFNLAINGQSDGSDNKRRSVGETPNETNPAGNHTHNFTTDTDGEHTHNIEIEESGGEETRPRNIALHYCIHTGQQGQKAQ